MRGIFKVEFSSKWTGVLKKKSSAFTKDDLVYDDEEGVTVLVNGDADNAISKARNWAVGRHVDTDLEDDKGKTYAIRYSCTGFSLRSVKLIATAEI